MLIVFSDSWFGMTKMNFILKQYHPDSEGYRIMQIFASNGLG